VHEMTMMRSTSFNTPDKAEEMSSRRPRTWRATREPQMGKMCLTSITGIFLLRTARFGELWNCMYSAALQMFLTDSCACFGTPAVLRRGASVCRLVEV
jgi:hypothetical protein